jgi:hypothetical protein
MKETVVISKVCRREDSAQNINRVLEDLVERVGGKRIMDLSVLPCGDSGILFCAHCNGKEAKRWVRVSKVFDEKAPVEEIQQILSELVDSLGKRERIAGIDCLRCGDSTSVFLVFLEGK